MMSHHVIHQVLSSQPPLTIHQKEALRKLPQLKPYGYNELQMQNWAGEFYQAHADALSYLSQSGISPEEAIKIVSGLDIAAARGVSQGLKREDAIGFNLEQIDTLYRLKDKLTATQLRTWRGKEFVSSHEDALKYLINNCGKSPLEAIAEINELNSCEARGVSKGLTRDEAKGLSDYQVSALLTLRQANPEAKLTSTHLRGWVGDYFSHSHESALIYLINERHLEPDIAVAELNNLTEFEARMIAEKKITREEVFRFSYSEITVLQNLKKFGLMPEHLRNWEKPKDVAKGDDEFQHGHAKALTYLIKNNNIKPEDAIKQLNGLDEDQAERIAKEKRLGPSFKP